MDPSLVPSTKLDQYAKCLAGKGWSGKKKIGLMRMQRLIERWMNDSEIDARFLFRS